MRATQSLRVDAAHAPVKAHQHLALLGVVAVLNPADDLANALQLLPLGRPAQGRAHAVHLRDDAEALAEVVGRIGRLESYIDRHGVGALVVFQPNDC
jgi:hypothetical protein